MAVNVDGLTFRFIPVLIPAYVMSLKKCEIIEAAKAENRSVSKI